MNLYENSDKPLVSLVLPAYNEAAIIAQSIEIICTYMQSLEDRYNWEIILVNDGSKDDTKNIANKLALKYTKVKVFHHPVNLNLGNALKTGFAQSKGDYVITMDLDLSYSVDHIELLLDTIETTMADMVLASPYMIGGTVTGVPFKRLLMSRFVNWMMSIASQDKHYTFTCMVRAYKGDFIRSLNLKTRDFEISPEIIYKAMILRARIVEIPAHLDWTFQNKAGKGRTSGLRIFKGIFSSLMASFIFRPYIYFLTFGFFLFGVFLYQFVWLLINTFKVYSQICVKSTYFDDKFSHAVARTFAEKPHAFLVIGFTLIVAMQLISIGFLSLQKKRYFEELFHISTSINKKLK